MRELPLVTVLALAGLVLVLGLRDGASTHTLAANGDADSADATTTVALADPASDSHDAGAPVTDELAPVEATGSRALADARGPADDDEASDPTDEPLERDGDLGVAPQPRVDSNFAPPLGGGDAVGLREEGRFHRGRRHGEWISLHEDGSVRERGQYVDGMKDGLWETFSPAGSLLVEAEYVEGQMDGDWRAYADAGDLIGEGQYDENLRSGRWTLWYSNGSVKERGRYVGGLREGVWEFFDDLGRPTVRTGTYRAGIRID